MKIFFSTFIIFLSISSLAQAENHLLMIGGGGEPKEKKTIFDNGLNKFSKNLKKSKWKYEVSFNGGHKKTEKILAKRYSKGIAPTTSFTQSNYVDLIESYRNKILTGQIKSGEQLMIIINSHGAERNNGENTHSIATSGGVALNLATLSGASLVSLDNLQEIVNLTNERGIKLGIVDLSCHSGTILALKKNAPNTCIVTATGPDHWGFTGPKKFSNNFLTALKPGVNLEDAFLKARLESNDSGYPMISTIENDKIIKNIYENITPYLYYYKPNEDKLTPYIFDNSTVTLFCKRQDDFTELISKINELQSVVRSKKKSFNADKLKELLLQYKKNQDEVLLNSMKLGSYKLDTVEIFSMPVNAYTKGSILQASYTWRELLDFNAEGALEFYVQNKKNLATEEEKEQYQAVIEFLKRVNTRKQQPFLENPQLINYKDQTALLVQQMNQTQELANSIAIQEKKLYEELYRRNQTNNPNEPCRSIVF